MVHSTRFSRPLREGVIRHWIATLLTGVVLAILAAGFWQVWSAFTDRDALMAEWPGVKLAPTVAAGSAEALRQATRINRSAAQTDFELSLTETSPISTSSIAPDDASDKPRAKTRKVRKRKRRVRRRARRSNWVEAFHNRQR